MCRCIREDDAYDYVIFDCPPAFNAASAAALLASDEVIIPIKLDAFSLRGLANVRRRGKPEELRRIALAIAVDQQHPLLVLGGEDVRRVYGGHGLSNATFEV